MTDITVLADELALAARELIWAVRGDSGFQISYTNCVYFTRLQDAYEAYELRRALEKATK